jgi:hypothetical protein
MYPEHKILLIYSFSYTDMHGTPFKYPTTANTHEEAKKKYDNFITEMTKHGCKHFTAEFSGTMEVPHAPTKTER